MGRPTKSNSTNWYKDYTEKALSKIEVLLSALKIDYTMRLDNIVDIACPVHGSDDVGHSIIYLNSGTWICFSGNCHVDYGKSVLGLIKGTLDKSGAPCSWDDVKKVIDETAGAGSVERKIKEYVPPDLFKDESTLPEIRIPSKYYLIRGFKEETLKYFEIGDAYNFPYKNKAIVPIRYINGEYMGFSARSHYPKCKKCEYHHSKYEECISKDYDFHFMHKRWHHCSGLQKSKTLYGIDKVRLLNTTKVAIVEGPSCVWKLYEHNIPTVSCLGKNFSNFQYELLKKLDIKKILFLNDDDEAGKEFRNRFVSEYHDKFSIYFSKLTAKDPSEMSDQDIKNTIIKTWEKM